MVEQRWGRILCPLDFAEGSRGGPRRGDLAQSVAGGSPRIRARGYPPAMRPPLPAPPTRKVLAVDDSPTVRAALEALLEPLGFEVVHAEHGAAALQLLRTSAFDLVFLDLEMPVLDGPSLLRFLRQHRDPTRVVLLTSAETSSVAATIKLGVSDYLPKPFDARGVRAVLDRVLGDQACRLEPAFSRSGRGRARSSAARFRRARQRRRCSVWARAPAPGTERCRGRPIRRRCARRSCPSACGRW